MKAGEKKYEYRRKFPKTKTTAFIYVTSPVKQIKALVEFGEPIVGPVDRISQIAEQQRTGLGKEIATYMSGLKEGFAIPVLKVREVSPVDLEEMRELFPGFAAPQSYMILDNRQEILEFLLARLKRDTRES